MEKIAELHISGFPGKTIQKPEIIIFEFTFCTRICALRCSLGQGTEAKGWCQMDDVDLTQSLASRMNPYKTQRMQEGSKAPQQGLRHMHQRTT